MRIFCKQLTDALESFELGRVSARIEEEHRGLPADLSLEANAGLANAGDETSGI